MLNLRNAVTTEVLLLGHAEVFVYVPELKHPVHLGQAREDDVLPVRIPVQVVAQALGL